MLDDAELRRALAMLRRPDRLVTPAVADLLAARGLVPAGASAFATAQAAAGLLRDAIERVRPPEGARREQQLPYDILWLRFVEGATVRHAARELGMSERQLCREQAWAIGLVKSELTQQGASPTASPTAPAPGARPPALAALAVPPPAYQPEPIPTLEVHLPRHDVADAVDEALAATRFLHVWGAPGLGKTTVVADLAARLAETHRVFWYRVRRGVNDSFATLVYDLGDFFAAAGDDRVAVAVAEHDTALAARLALKAFATAEHLVVVDGFEVFEPDPATGGFLDEAVGRVPTLRVVAVSRHATPASPRAAVYSVAPLALAETSRLLTLLDVEAGADTVAALHEWTAGVPQLVTLAAAWLKSAGPEIDVPLDGLAGVAEVHDFLLGTLTDLIDPDDRQILGAATVFRDRFSDAALATVAGRSRGAVLDAIRRLVRSHVAVRGRNGENAFFHPTVRNFVYDRLPAAERATLHRRAAACFAARGDATEAAYHAERARNAAD